MFLPSMLARESGDGQDGVNAVIPPLALQVSLELAGLVALAEITVVNKWTALSGGANLLDWFILCPGLHRQHHSTSLNEGEYPATAALTTGYVFRVENQGTVFYLQRMGRTGHLTPLKVRRMPGTDNNRHKSTLARLLTFPWSYLSTVSLVTYALCILLTITVIILMGLAEDWWGLFVIGILIICRGVISFFLTRRSDPTWFGGSEPGKSGDLIILLSQDRWVRLRGPVDDLKAVTSGQWFRDMNRFESFMVSLATVLVYVDAALASNLKTFGKILLIILLVGTAGLLDLSTEATEKMIMHDRIIEPDGTRKKYERRLALAKQLIAESNRSDWALRIGMVNESDLENLDLEQNTLNEADEAQPGKNVSQVEGKQKGPVSQNSSIGGKVGSTVISPTSKVTM